MLERFCAQVIKRPDLLTDKVVKSWPGPPPDLCKWIASESAVEIAKQPQQHWIDACLAADVPCAPVASYKEIADSTTSVGRHMSENGYTRTVNHRDWGQISVVGPPTVYHGTPNQLPPPDASWHAPRLGEHALEILRGDLGFPAAEAERLQQGVAKPVGPYAEEAVRDRREKVKARFYRPPRAKL